jgi:AbrB family looped-hinge helix DNA binding protein
MEKSLIVKVSSNDSVPLIYIPKEVREALGLIKGVYAKLTVKDNKLIVEKLDLE